mmetsp:Transcript_4483/g.16611  ORF Transcript_4483/g.16611 Transcript_4483/m.16611 type:complete len:379 (+) Transcript_4483:6186-7322(+)
MRSRSALVSSGSTRRKVSVSSGVRTVRAGVSSKVLAVLVSFGIRTTWARSLFKTASAASASSATRADSSHVFASATAVATASTSSHATGNNWPFCSSNSAESMVNRSASTASSSALLFSIHVSVSKSAASKDARSLGCTGRAFASARSLCKSEALGSSVRAARCLFPGSVFRKRSLHACAAATVSRKRFADVTSSGPRVVSAARDIHRFGFGNGRSASADATLSSRSSPAASALENASESESGRGNGAASSSSLRRRRVMRRGGATAGASFTSFTSESSILTGVWRSIAAAATSLITFASAAALAVSSATRLAAASASVSRSTYLPFLRTRTGAPAAAATTISASSTVCSCHATATVSPPSTLFKVASIRFFRTPSSR